MQEFYKRAFLVGASLLVASILLGYTFLRLSYLHFSLLPSGESSISLHAQPSWELRPDRPVTMQIHEDKRRLRFDFSLGKADEWVQVAVDLMFRDRKEQAIHVDLSRYSSISMRVKCSPANTLALSIPTYEEGVSRPEDFLKYRALVGYLACNENESRTELDLSRLETPKWWYLASQQSLSRPDYKLDKVPKITIGSSAQSPANVISRIDVSEMELNGRDYRYLLLFAAAFIIAWSFFGLWFFRKHSQALISDVKSKIQKDMPFVAYQQLSLKPQRDKEKTAILQYIATNYANTELDVDTVVEQTGVNRNKIFDVLKSELGFTFSGYLNKLRLTEAARLLAEQDSATVAEIAFSVGYGNISYFNKLFKEEYGCTPKAFRSACKPRPA
jgi:AraC-like DNA-binding protein